MLFFRNFRRLAGAGLLVAGATTSAHAEDLFQVYELALKKDPQYLAGFYQHDASKEIYDQALAVLLPKISFEYSRTDTDQTIKRSNNPVFNSENTSYPTDDMTLSITQSIYSYSNWAYFKQAKEDVKRATAELDAVHQDMLLRVAERYFDVLAERESYSYIQAEVDSLQKHYELVSEKRLQGLARITDELDAQARYLQAESRKVELGNQLRDALQGLQEVIGYVPEEIALAQEEIPLVSPNPESADAWVDQAQGQNPTVVEKRQAVLVAAQETKRQQGGHYPTLDFVATMNNNDTQGSLFGGGSEVETTEMLVKLTVPIYSGGAVSSKVRESVNLHLKAQEELEQEWRTVKRETLAAYDGVVGAIIKVEALQKSVDSYELAVDAKKTAYESGLTSSISVLDAERDLFFARSEYARARYDYLKNTLRLKRAVGALAEDDIRQVNGLLENTQQPVLKIGRQSSFSSELAGNQ